MRPINRYTEGLDGSRILWGVITGCTILGALLLICKG